MYLTITGRSRFVCLDDTTTENKSWQVFYFDNFTCKLIIRNARYFDKINKVEVDIYDS